MKCSVVGKNNKKHLWTWYLHAVDLYSWMFFLWLESFPRNVKWDSTLKWADSEDKIAFKFENWNCIFRNCTIEKAGSEVFILKLYDFVNQEWWSEWLTAFRNKSAMVSFAFISDSWIYEQVWNSFYTKPSVPIICTRAELNLNFISWKQYRWVGTFFEPDCS